MVYKYIYYNGNKKSMIRIFRNLYELKVHCRDSKSHRKVLTNCLFNYVLIKDTLNQKLKKTYFCW